MKRLFKSITACVVAALLMTSCDIRDGADICGSYIRFVYDYNLLYTDAFTKQASKIDLYVFDTDGRFDRKLSATMPAGRTFPDGYVMSLPQDMKGAYQFLALSGIYTDFYFTEPVNMVKGVTTMSDITFGLDRDFENDIDEKIPHMWHGKTGDIVITNTNETHKISMVKNTNSIRIVLQSMDGTPIDVDDFEFMFKAPNGSYNYENTPDMNRCATYIPHYTYTDPLAGAVAEIRTLRLMEGADINKFTMIQKPSNIIFDEIDLNPYFNALKLSDYDNITDLQEYLDREDQYKMVIFVRETTPGSGLFVSAKIEIQPWYVREQGEGSGESN